MAQHLTNLTYRKPTICGTITPTPILQEPPVEAAKEVAKITVSAAGAILAFPLLAALGLALVAYELLYNTYLDIEEWFEK